MYVYMYVCVCVCVCIYIYIYIYIYISNVVSLCMFACLYVRVHYMHYMTEPCSVSSSTISIHICMHPHVCLRVLCLHTYLYVYTLLYACCARVFLHTYAYLRVLTCPPFGMMRLIHEYLTTSCRSARFFFGRVCAFYYARMHVFLHPVLFAARRTCIRMQNANTHMYTYYCRQAKEKC
jgi:hypothetical protein